MRENNIENISIRDFWYSWLEAFAHICFISLNMNFQSIYSARIPSCELLSYPCRLLSSLLRRENTCSMEIVWLNKHNIRSSSLIWFVDIVRNHDMWQNFMRCNAASKRERGGKRLELNSSIFRFKLWNLQNHTFIGVLFYDAKTGASCHWKSSLKHHKVPLCDHKCSQRIAFEW